MVTLVSRYPGYYFIPDLNHARAGCEEYLSKFGMLCDVLFSNSAHHTLTLIGATGRGLPQLGIPVHLGHAINLSDIMREIHQNKFGKLPGSSSPSGKTFNERLAEQDKKRKTAPISPVILSRIKQSGLLPTNLSSEALARVIIAQRMINEQEGNRATHILYIKTLFDISPPHRIISLFNSQSHLLGWRMIAIEKPAYKELAFLMQRTGSPAIVAAIILSLVAAIVMVVAYAWTEVSSSSVLEASSSAQSSYHQSTQSLGDLLAAGHIDQATYNQYMTALQDSYEAYLSHQESPTPTSPFNLGNMSSGLALGLVAALLLTKRR